MLETNPVIGSGFDVSRGTFTDDTNSNGYYSGEIVHDHPFHNVDPNTMMAMKKALVVLQKVKGDNSVHQIADRIYLGSIGAALNLPELQSVGITHIMCTATGVRSMHPDKFVYKTLTVLDSQSELLLDHFADSIYWMECALRENSNHKILVHCFAGRSRSVAIVLAYLMYKLRIPLSVALLHVRQFRASANPNSGFINQLKAFEQCLLSSKRSFSFDTLWDDLNSLLEPSKALLKDMPSVETNIRSSMVPPRSNSFAVAAQPVASLSQPRPKSTDGAIEVFSAMNDLPERVWFSEWLILLVLLVAVVAAERWAFAYYWKPLCTIFGNVRAALFSSMFR